jgi:predicted nucleic acid-binding protein
MIFSSKFIVVLDACVLYPAPVRDLLLSFADEDLYKPKWTESIQDEWISNLLINRPDLKKEQLLRTVDAMNSAFPDSNVENYSSLISTVILPDEDDRHVVAASIRCKADAIVTYNLKDFPSSVMEKYDIEIHHPDTFLSDIYDLNPGKAGDAFKKLVNRLRNPPMKPKDVLSSLEKLDLFLIIKKLRTIC